MDLLNVPRVLFGSGSSYRLGDEVAQLGKKALVITGKSSLVSAGNFERITQPLKENQIDFALYQLQDSEPTIEVVDQARAKARAENCDFVLGVGGGSSLDVAKAVAGLFHEEAPTRSFFYGQAVNTAPLPWMAIPTTAGSGAETTINAVLIDPEAHKKASIRSEHWLPRVVILDALFTASLPPNLVIQSGMDAFTHGIEAFTSRWSNPFAEVVSQKAILLIMQNIFTVSQPNARAREARENMLLASYMAGMAVNQVRTGLVHALAHSVGVRYQLPHGLVCGILLPYVMEYNLPRVYDRFAQIARLAGIATGGQSDEQAADRFIYYVYRLREKLSVPKKLSEVGLVAADISAIALRALESSSIEANPRMVGVHDVKEILEKNL